jgi:hypothetical protein
MSHQEELTIVAPIKPGCVAAAEQLLGTIEHHAQNGGLNVIPFAQLGQLHFASLFVLPESVIDGEPLPAQLVLMTNIDAPLSTHLGELTTVAGDGLDRVFGLCDGYPEGAQRTAERRDAFLRDHRVRAEVFYVNRQGRTVQQIRGEDELRRVIETHLDSAQLAGECAECVRDSILQFVRSQPALSWALRPAEGTSWLWQLREKLSLAGELATVVLLSPVLIPLAPLAIFALRRHEDREIPDRSAATPERIRELRADEDFWVQNQIVAAGAFKPAWFRRRAAGAILNLADFAVRHIYNRGSLSGLNTIHFARWVKSDGGRRLFFASNYDGSLESYMNDFIDKAAWGLNAIFSSGDGFPRTAFLFCLGITDEIAYKRFLPTRQIRTRVWYSAYPHLTTKNIANAAEIRRGLSASMNAEQTRSWLRRFGVGNELPQPNVVARLLDSIRWDVTCQACK